MIATHEPSRSACLRTRSRHRYVMLFRGSRRGLAKRVELWSVGANDALELALADQAQRTVEVRRTATSCAALLALSSPMRMSGLDVSSKSHGSSRPDSWAAPRPYQDESLRRKKHGPIRPMEEPGFFCRLFKR